MTAPLEPEALGHAARVALGVTGRQQVARYPRAAGDRGRSRVTSLSRLAFADTLPSVLLLLLVATIAPDLSTTEPTLRTALVAGALVTVLASFLALGLTRSGRRLTVAVVVGTNAGLVAVVAAQLSILWAVLAVLALRAALLGVGVVVQRPLLVDVAPPEARVRALARWRAGAVLGAAAAAGLAALAVGGPQWGWRAMVGAAGGLAAILGLAVAFVDDPGLGGFERSRLTRLVGPAAAPSDVPGPVGRSLDRAARTRAVRVSLTGYVGVGFALVGPVLALVSYVQGLGFTTPATLVGLAVAWVVAAAATLLASDGLEARRRRSPGSLAAAVPVLLLVAAAGLVVAGLSTSAIAALVGAGVLAAGAALAAAVLDATALSAVEARDRAAVSALTALSLAGGGVLGLVWLEAAGNRLSAGSALLSLALPVAACALASLRLPKAADQALDDVVAELTLRAETAPPADGGEIPRWARSVDTSALWRPDLPPALLPPAGYSGSAPTPRALTGPPVPDPLDPSVPVEALGAAAASELVVRLVPDPEAAPVPTSSEVDALTAPLDQLDGIDELGESGGGAVWEYSLPAAAAATAALGATNGSNGSNGTNSINGVAAPLHHELPPRLARDLLEARGVSYSYGSVQVLFDVDVRVEQGELVALLGPNGVGKTTLLRVLSGLAKPSQGQVLLAGEDVTRLGASRRVPLGLSEIVGGQAVFGSMTVAENLRMYGFTLGRDKAAVDAGTQAAFEVFPRLGERRNQLASTLSGGEQQMLGLSKALMLKPQVLLVDEFSLGLAPVVVGELMGLVRRLNADGTAILLVEQSVNVALALARRVYFMEKGRIVHEGLAEELRERPDLVAELTLGGHADRLTHAVEAGA